MKISYIGHLDTFFEKLNLYTMKAKATTINYILVF